MDLQIKKDTNPKPESVDVTGRMPAEPKQYKVVKKNVSDNIRAFDDKAKEIKNKPQEEIVQETIEKPLQLSPEEMRINPIYNGVAKFLGVDTQKEWSRFYDKVQYITDKASESVGKNIDAIIKYLMGEINKAPSMSDRRIKDLYIYLKMQT